MKYWFWNVLVSLDQLVNALSGFALNYALRPTHRFGFPDETLSSVFGKNLQSGTCRFCGLICRLLDRIDPGHCRRNIEHDEGDKTVGL